jgi:hypothetical protein
MPRTHGFAPRGKKYGREYIAWHHARRYDKSTPGFEIFLLQVGPCPAQKGAELRRQPDGSYVWRRGSKLTEVDVKEIRALRTAGFEYKQISPLFSISPALVGKIVNFKLWKE